ncbi:DUF4347 domain-containing protein, partial [Geitlerinema sp. P-1104]|uniref:DUF4347 domain-containing protein n=1 Tax=Geitlerinema sp. P-1104 TaxID=2546230 RepID=UPI001476F096
DTSSGIPDWGEGKGDWAIALYGCQVAAGDAGAEFVERLHHLTGATISASTRVVGQADLGGTWNLDVQQGLGLVPGVVLDESVRRSYGGVFPDFDLGPSPANQVLEITLTELLGLNSDTEIFPERVTTQQGITLDFQAGTTFRYDPRNLDVFRALPEFEAGNTNTFIIDEFNFRASPDGSTFPTRTALIKVRGVNEAPVASNFSIGIGDPPLLKNAIFDDITDPDDDKALRQNVTDIDNKITDLVFSGDDTSARGAVVTINEEDGTYTYDPRNVAEIQRIPDGQTITDTFQYIVKDPGGLTDRGTVTVQIRGLNTAVVANDNEATVRRGESVTIPVLANDTNIEGGP